MNCSNLHTITTNNETSINFYNKKRISAYICVAVSTPVMGHYSWLSNACAGGFSRLLLTTKDNHMPVSKQNYLLKHPHRDEIRYQKLGYSKHPLYRAYRHMIDRCFNVHSPSYHWYGARGITVCTEWKNYPNRFIEWAEKNRYQKGLQLDRENNNGNYEPSNCRFVTPRVNSRNTRKNIIAEYKGQTKLFIEWCEEFGLHYKNVYLMCIHNQKLSPTEALQMALESSNPKYFISQEAFKKAHPTSSIPQLGYSFIKL